MCNNLAGTLPYMQNGQIRILAQTGKSRSASAPDIPTFEELGVKGLDTGLWMGIVAPKGTPAAVTATLTAALSKVMKDPATVEALHKLGATPLAPTRDDFVKRIQTDEQAWKPVLQNVNLKEQ